MAERFKNKYRIKSARLEDWDYRWNAAYFITICTAHRKHYFGEIKNGKMDFSPVGVIADILWHEILHHTSYVQLGNFVVMPNHIHGILILNNPEIPEIENISEGNNEEGNNHDSPGNHPHDPVQTLHATSPQPSHHPEDPLSPKKFPNGQNLSQIQFHLHHYQIL